MPILKLHLVLDLSAPRISQAYICGLWGLLVLALE